MRQSVLKTMTILCSAALGLFGTSAQAQGEETTPPWSMADKYWGAEEMATAREEEQKANGDTPSLFVLFNQFEAQTGGVISEITP